MPSNPRVPKTRWFTTLSCVLVLTGTAQAQTARDTAQRLYTVGDSLYRLRTAENIRASIDMFHRSLDAARRAAFRPGEITALNGIAFAHGDLERPDSALAYYAQSAAVSHATGDRKREAATLSNIGVVHIGQGRVDSALAYYRLALPIQIAIADTPSVAFTHNNMGVAHKEAGRADSALFYYKMALASRRLLADTSGMAATLNNLGAVYMNVGQIDSALVYYAAALPLRRAAKDMRGVGNTLSNIGVAYTIVLQYDSAVAYLRQAVDVHRAAGYKRGEGVSLGAIGDLYLQQERFDSSLVYQRLALDVSRALGDRLKEGNQLTNIGVIYLSTGPLDSALRYVELAVANHRATGNRLGLGETMTALAQVNFKLSRIDLARAQYDTALSLARETHDRLSETVCLQAIGQILHRHSVPIDLPRAIAYYDSAAAIGSTLTSSAGGDANRVSFAEQAIALYGEWSLAWLGREHEVGAAVAARAALAVAERGRARALLYLMSPDSSSSAPAEAGADVAAQGRELLRRTTASGTAVLYYFATQDTLLVWFAEPSGRVLVQRHPISPEALASFVSGARANLDDGASRKRSLAFLDGDTLPLQRGITAGVENGARANEELYARLVGPLIGSRLSSYREVLVIPHGALELVSFAALPGAKRQPLGAAIAFRYAPSISTAIDAEGRSVSIRRGVNRARFVKPLVVGNPTMPAVSLGTGPKRKLPPLPGAEREAAAVAHAVGTVALTGAAATESAVRRRLAGASLIHLATHAFAFSSDARARDSFVALAADSAQDGLLTVGKLMDDPDLRLNADLVVLSACQTGLGNLKQAEGTVGLQRAFLARGARSLLVSLWSVDDRATALLMRRFYEHLLTDRDLPSKARALQRAQSDVRLTAGLSDPRYWAGFQLVGAP